MRRFYWSQARLAGTGATLPAHRRTCLAYRCRKRLRTARRNAYNSRTSLKPTSSYPRSGTRVRVLPCVRQLGPVAARRAQLSPQSVRHSDTCRSPAADARRAPSAAVASR
jgi:hypothetical protein